MLKKILLVIFSFIFTQNMMMAQGKTIDDAYILRLQKQVKTNWIMPKVKGTESAVIVFTITPDGKVTNARILRPSDNAQFDQSALMAIYKTIPFEKISVLEDSDENYNSTYEFFFSTNSTNLTKVDDNLDILIMDKEQVSKYGSYIRNLDRRIKSNWSESIYPTDRSAVTLFKVKKDGSIDDLKILKSSTDEKFDAEILKAINDSLPLDLLPSVTRDNYIQVQYSFLYTILKDEGNSRYNTICCIVTNKTYLGKDIETYKQQVEKLLAIYVPKDRYYKNKNIKIRITLAKNGEVSDLIVINSSKDAEFDAKIINTFKKCSFPPIPSSLNKSAITLDYSIKTQKTSSCDFMTNVVWLYKHKLIPNGILWY